MNRQPTLVQELETAKILQELSQHAAAQSRPSIPLGVSSEEPKKRIPSLKRKHWASSKTPTVTDAATKTPNFSSKSPTNTHPSSTFGRAVSPATEYESSSGDASSCASLPSTPREPCFKPLSPPPKLRRVSFYKKTGRPTSSLSTIHPSPPKKKQNVLTLPSTYNNNLTQINATNAMIFQLLSNPMLCTATIPLCQPTGSGNAPMLSEKINIQPKTVPLKPLPILTAKSTALDKSKKPKRKLCRMDDCDEEAAQRTPYCKKHCGQRKCEHEGCKKCAQGRTRFCIGHGGGRRCQFEGCTKGARDKQFCASHGGGRRCNIESCTKLAVGRGRTCTAHGGGRRCQHESCSKSAQSSSDFCVRHGGGRKCLAAGCSKVARGKLGLCMSHATKQEFNLY